MTAFSGEDEWQWERKFIIDADEAQALNRADITIDTSRMIGSINLFVLLLGGVLQLLIQKKKDKISEINKKE